MPPGYHAIGGHLEFPDRLSPDPLGTELN